MKALNNVKKQCPLSDRQWALLFCVSGGWDSGWVGTVAGLGQWLGWDRGRVGTGVRYVSHTWDMYLTPVPTPCPNPATSKVYALPLFFALYCAGVILYFSRKIL